MDTHADGLSAAPAAGTRPAPQPSRPIRGGHRSTVPVGRRLVLAEPRRLAAGALAVGLALMLVLLFQGCGPACRPRRRCTRTRPVPSTATMLRY